MIATAASRGVSVALAVILSLAPGPTWAAPPSDRDLAYEQGLRAEEAGDDAGAAQQFSRAYRLTVPAETGPRLLFLRAGVAAYLRAHAAAPDAIEPLCHARELLREHLEPTAVQPGPKDSSPPAPPADLRASLERVEQQLAGRSCTPPAEAETPPVDPPPDAEPAEKPVLEDTSQPTPAAPAVHAAPPLDRRRALQIAGAVNLGAGVASFVGMFTGIGLARAAYDKGKAECAGPTACYADDPEDTDLSDAHEDGPRANKMIAAFAVIGGIETVIGVALLAVSARVRPRRPLALVPRIAPGSAGISLSGRF